MPRRYRQMPKGLQIFLLKKKYGDLDAVDWDAIVDVTLTFRENVQCIERDHMEEIEQAQHDSGYETESEKRFRLEAEAHARAQENTLRRMQESAWETEPEAVPEENAQQESTDSEGWHVERTSDGEIHSIELEIKPNPVKSKGKRYRYGRIQLCVDPKFIGLTAKIIIAVPDVLL